MLGAGIALLLSEKLSAEQRRAIGWTLVAVGAITTIPLVLQLFSEDE
jgi:EamA domain-containing membrane protein RarD